MIKPIVFQTVKGNSYAYSPIKNQMGLAHPVILFFINEVGKGKDADNLLAEVESKGGLNLDKYGEFTVGEVKYYHKKYKFLARKGYFTPKKRINLDGKLLPSDVEDNLAHIQQIIFEVTEECNLSCTYCAYSKYYVNKERKASDLNLEKAKLTLKYFLERRQKLSTKPITISFYGGEPLKNMKLITDVVSFLKAIPDNRVPLRFSMTSNGLLLKKYIGYLAEHSFDVGISLDGNREGNRYRLTNNKKPSFDIVIRNLDYVQANYPEFFDKNISFLSVMHNRNNYDSIYRFFHEKYNKISLISDISTVNLNKEHVNEFHEVFFKDKIDDRNDEGPMKVLRLRHPRVKSVSSMVEVYSGMVFKSHYKILASNNGNQYKKKYIPTATCAPFSMRTFITTEGTILPCEHISRLFEIGKVDDDAIRIDPVDIAKMYNHHFEKIKKFCNNCYLSESCQECVFNTGVETEKISCDFFLNERKFREFMAKHYSIIENDYSFYLSIAKDAFREQG